MHSKWLSRQSIQSRNFPYIIKASRQKLLFPDGTWIREKWWADHFIGSHYYLIGVSQGCIERFFEEKQKRSKVLVRIDPYRKLLPTFIPVPNWAWSLDLCLTLYWLATAWNHRDNHWDVQLELNTFIWCIYRVLIEHVCQHIWIED